MTLLEGFLYLVTILFSIGIAAGLAKYSYNGRWIPYLFWAAVIAIAVFVVIFIIPGLLNK